MELKSISAVFNLIVRNDYIYKHSYLIKLVLKFGSLGILHSLSRNPFLKRFYWAIGLILSLAAAGIIGFMSIEGYKFVEAFYMTIITLASVGFMEVHPLSMAGQIFTSCLIICNIGIFAYSLTTFTSLIIQGDLKNVYIEFMMQNKIDKLQDHIILCGFGRNGRKVAEELVRSKTPFVVIENIGNNPAHDGLEGILHIKGDATDDDVLVSANIKNARALITTLPKDTDNVYVVLSAKEHNKNIVVISRASEESSLSKLKRAGADHVVIPEHIGGAHMASLITRLGEENFLGMLGSKYIDNLYFEEISFENFPSEYKGKSVQQINATSEGICVMGAINAEGDLILNSNREILAGQKIIILKKHPDKR
ncbi:MAG TPA: NAD-binding protein [Cytophagaceae bacterium]|jgi:voltage-gated potassium channel